MTEVRCWRDQSACRDLVTAEYDPFFADAAELQAEAIAICETCLVRDACLTFAVRTGQQYGIWGGQPRQVIRRLIALERAGRPHSRRAPGGHPQASKTHCKRGHRFDRETPPTPPTASAAAASACASPNRPVPADAGEEATQVWRGRDPHRENQHVPDTFWLVVAVVLFAACGLVWLIGQVEQAGGAPLPHRPPPLGAGVGTGSEPQPPSRPPWPPARRGPTPAGVPADCRRFPRRRRCRG